MANDFKVEGFNLEDLLANKKMSYQIPSYQRPYAWDKDQISDLIEDRILLQWQGRTIFLWFISDCKRCK